MKRKSAFIRLWLIIGALTGFASVIFFTSTYLIDSMLCNADCRIKNELSLVIVMLSLFGVFIGSLTYYFISDKYEKKITAIHKDLSATYKFLQPDQKKIVMVLVELNGCSSQSEIVKKTNLSKVKVSRELKQLEKMQVIEKSRHGMTNKISLSADLSELFK